MSENQEDRKPIVHNPIEKFSESILKNPEQFGEFGRQVMDQQTTKQPVFWICNNQDCLPDIAKPNKKFVFERDQPLCPKCTCGPPMVHKRALIHLLLPNPTGEVVGFMQRRFSIACDYKRHSIATLRNGETGTGDVNLVNCPGCMKRIEEAIARQSSRVVLRKGDLIQTEGGT